MSVRRPGLRELTRVTNLIQALVGVLSVGVALTVLGDGHLGLALWRWLGPLCLMALGLAALGPVLRRRD